MAGKVHSPVVDGFDAWFAAFTKPTVLIELGALLVCLGLAWALVALLRRGLKTSNSILFGRSVVDGALFPLLLLAFGCRKATLYLGLGDVDSLPRFLASGVIYTAAITLLCLSVPAVVGFSRQELRELFIRFKKSRSHA